MQDENQAKDTLTAFSQNTHYLLDWKKQEARRHPSDRRSLPAAVRKMKATEGLSPRKFDERRYERKQDVLNRFEYPLIIEEPTSRAGTYSKMKSLGQLKLTDLKKSKKEKYSKVIERLVE